jgi:hypothetical protein
MIRSLFYFASESLCIPSISFADRGTARCVYISNGRFACAHQPASSVDQSVRVKWQYSAWYKYVLPVWSELSTRYVRSGVLGS